MFQVICIKCQTKYESDDSDPYYCPACTEEKKRIAERIDKQFANRPKEQPMSPLQAYDASEKVRGFIKAKL